HELRVSLPPEPARVIADAARLAQALSNLLHNAAKYTPEGGRISLAVAREGGEVVFRVRDSGSGIRPEQLPRIFDLLAQADRSLHRSQGGRGLGLTLVRRIVEMHGGSVQAFSEGLGTGSEFVIRLPAAGPAGGGADAPSCRVLVVGGDRAAADRFAAPLRA